MAPTPALDKSWIRVHRMTYIYEYWPMFVINLRLYQNWNRHILLINRHNNCCLFKGFCLGIRGNQKAPLRRPWNQRKKNSCIFFIRDLERNLNKLTDFWNAVTYLWRAHTNQRKVEKSQWFTIELFTSQRVVSLRTIVQISSEVYMPSDAIYGRWIQICSLNVDPRM